MKKIFKWIGIIVLVLIVALGATIGVLYSRQDEIVQELLTKANADFKGEVKLTGSHISLFQNFPYISIDLENLSVKETKADSAAIILNVEDVYVGFDLITILNGKMEIKKIKLVNGYIDAVQYVDGTFNLANAFEPVVPVESVEEEFHLDLKSVILSNIHLTKLNVESRMKVDVLVDEAKTRFKTNTEKVVIGLDADFNLSLLINGDSTAIKKKNFEFDTELNYLKVQDLLVIEPTTAKLQGAEFNMEGSVNFKDDANLNLKFDGNKSNFDLFMAMAPTDLEPTLKKYDNKGKIFFEATIVGKSTNGHAPAVNARFGCEQAFFKNTDVDKKVDQLNFSGYFTNGEKRNPSTMEFGIKDFSARPEAGTFTGDLVVKNFESPDINLQLKSDFDLNFLAKFFGLTDLYDLMGKIELTMNFRDIIDLESPEKSIEKLNESYFTQLKITDLSFGKGTSKLPIKDVDMYAEMNGHEAKIDYCNVLIGKSDVSIKGTVSDLPAIIHHTDLPVTTKLDIKSKYLDLYELTGADTATSINEQIKNLSLGLHFNSSAKAITESPNLPIGEFFIDNLFADLSNYPHTLHDFHADVYIEEEDFRVIDFKGLIDKSDFHFSGRLQHYDLWFAEHPKGDTRVEFTLDSKKLLLEDIFSYNGENFVPEDYRHEEFDNLKISGYSDLHFNEGMQSVDLYLKGFEAKMKVHPLRFENFKGRVHYEKDHLTVEDFSGKLGHSEFKTTLHYYLGKDEKQKLKENRFELYAKRLDFDELFKYNLSPAPDKTSGSVDSSYHDGGFNIYELPFTHMTFDVDIDKLNYHKYLIDNFKLKARTTPEHYIYLDKFYCEAADGSFDVKGYLNGSNPNRIYIDPDLTVKNVDLDKLMFKFDNFGQDYLVNENLHGKLNGRITGHIRVHKDLVPIVNESEIHMDVEVLDGRLENFAMLQSMSDFFGDKNLNKVLFDTLANHIDVEKGMMKIPNMVINSSLGFMQLSGQQDFDMNMDYYVRVPWGMVTQAASSKLFGRKKEEVDPEQVDEIQRKDLTERTRYVNVRIKGNTEDYKITLEKDPKLKRNKSS